MAKKYIIDLTDKERQTLKDLYHSHNAKPRARKRSHILILADKGFKDQDISETVLCSISHVEKVRKRFVLQGLDSLHDKRHPGRLPKLDEKGELILEEIARSKPPRGRSTWTLSLLADRLVTLEVVDSISYEAVRRVLKKKGFDLGSAKSGA